MGSRTKRHAEHAIFIDVPKLWKNEEKIKGLSFAFRVDMRKDNENIKPYNYWRDNPGSMKDNAYKSR